MCAVAVGAVRGAADRRSSAEWHDAFTGVVQAGGYRHEQDADGTTMDGEVLASVGALTKEAALHGAVV